MDPGQYFPEKQSVAIYNTTDMCAIYAEVGGKRSVSNSKYFAWYTIKRSSSKVPTSCFVIQFRRNFSASAVISSINASLLNACSKCYQSVPSLAALLFVPTLLAVSHPVTAWIAGRTSTKSESKLLARS